MVLLFLVFLSDGEYANRLSSIEIRPHVHAKVAVCLTGDLIAKAIAAVGGGEGLISQVFADEGQPVLILIERETDAGVQHVIIGQ